MILKINLKKILHRFTAVFMAFLLCFTIVMHNTHKVEAFALVDDATVAIVCALLIAIGVVDISDGKADIVRTAESFVEFCLEETIDIVDFCGDCVANAGKFYGDKAKKGLIAIGSGALATFAGYFSRYLESKNIKVEDKPDGGKLIYSNYMSLVDIGSYFDSVLHQNSSITGNFKLFSNSSGNYYKAQSFRLVRVLCASSGVDYIQVWYIPYYRYPSTSDYCLDDGFYYGSYGYYTSYTSNGFFSSYYQTGSLDQVFSKYSFSVSLDGSDSVSYSKAGPIDQCFDMLLTGRCKTATFSYNSGGLNTMTFYDVQYLTDWIHSTDYDNYGLNDPAPALELQKANAITQPGYVDDLIKSKGIDTDADAVADVIGVSTPVNPDGDIIDENWRKEIGYFNPPDIIDKPWEDLGTLDPDVPVDPDIDVPSGEIGGILGGIQGLINSLIDFLKGILQSILDAIKGLVAALIDALKLLLATLFVPTVAIEERLQQLANNYTSGFNSSYFLIDEVPIPDVTLNGTVYVSNKFLRDNIPTFRLMLDIFISFLYVVHCFRKFSRLLGKGGD